MNNEIWINPKYSGGGYSAVKQYEDDFISVSRGGLNSRAFAEKVGHAPRLIFITFPLMDITIVGDDKEDVEFMQMLEKNDAGLPSRLHKFALRLLADHLSDKWFKYIINNAYTKGVKDGRNEIRDRFRSLMTEEI